MKPYKVTTIDYKLFETVEEMENYINTTKDIVEKITYFDEKEFDYKDITSEYECPNCGLSYSCEECCNHEWEDDDMPDEDKYLWSNCKKCGSVTNRYVGIDD